MAFILSLGLVMDLVHPKWLAMTMEVATEEEEEVVATGVDMEVDTILTVVVLEEGDIQVVLEEVAIEVVEVLDDLVEAIEVQAEDIRVGEIEGVVLGVGGVGRYGYWRNL